VLHPKNADLSKWVARLPKGVQIVSCCVQQVESWENQFNVVAITDKLVSLEYFFTDYGVDYDFSAIRNFIDQNATGKWLLHIDSDEYIGCHPEQVIAEIEDIDAAGADAGWITIAGMMYKTSNEIHPRERYALHACRLIRRGSGITWEGICHEVPTTHGEARPFVDTDIILIHDGYMIESEDFEEKAERNAKLLIREYTRKPTPRVWNYLIKTFSTIKLKDKPC
jgi:hypothetical protein